MISDTDVPELDAMELIAADSLISTVNAFRSLGDLLITKGVLTREDLERCFRPGALGEDGSIPVNESVSRFIHLHYAGKSAHVDPLAPDSDMPF